MSSTRMRAYPKVGIIVLNYNGKLCLPLCLNSLAHLEYPNTDIIVVDNHSTDDSLAAAEKQFPHLTFIRNATNEGFAKGMNRGMHEALARGAQWCWLFNYDALADPAALSLLISAAEREPKAGLLSPVICARENGHTWFAKGEIDFLRMRTTHVPATERELASAAYPSKFLTGCALLIKKELIDAIGFLDERFFLYYEDADYSRRAWRAGFTCLVVPKARVWHSEESRFNPEKVYFLVYSGLLFFEKHAPLAWRPYQAAYVTIRRVKNFLDRICGKTGPAVLVHRAYTRYFYGR